MAPDSPQSIHGTLDGQMLQRLPVFYVWDRAGGMEIKEPRGGARRVTSLLPEGSCSILADPLK
jgi:hypothetical protein